MFILSGFLLLILSGLLWLILNYENVWRSLAPSVLKGWMVRNCHFGDTMKYMKWDRFYAICHIITATTSELYGIKVLYVELEEASSTTTTFCYTPNLV
jgi:hypothetical protein